eukprot:CAMPEP_0203761044 /NCGR_PEP_ID=MMETSP0098-20131031/14217_1 /ASSEMBLY_ACC=CAM_ASM_000208 /TAXON_ID=96639 /ORGANISM=" , Strain NY0313808BC1" /LENGTH=531 /DNA_ID=CAMNT_0050654865 /DNA_START=174 /DNA_END=1766 /DNA_ORIENTATION=-
MTTKVLDAQDGPQRGLNCYSILVLFTAVLGGLLFGLDVGTSGSVSLTSFREAMNIPIQTAGESDPGYAQNTLFNMVFHGSSLLGAPIAGMVADKFGRKPVIIAAASLFTTGAIWQACAGLLASSFAWKSVILGRVIGGVGNGFLLVIMPVYASELAPKQLRGKAITLFQLFITVGIFFMALYNKFFEHEDAAWRAAFALQAIPCFTVIILTVCVLPESPRFLIRKNRGAEAREALNKLAAGSENADAAVEAEFNQIAEEVAAIVQEGEGTFAELFQGTNLACVMCGVMVALSQNITGINWFMNYGPTLYTGLNLPSFTMDLLNKGLNMTATMVSFYVIERTGRKFLTVWGSILVIVFFLLIFVVVQGSGVDLKNPSSMAVPAFCVFMVDCFQVTFAITWGPLGWLVPSEVFQIRNRGKGMALCVTANMFTNILLGDYLFQKLDSLMPFGAVCMIICACNFVVVLPTVWFLQPETKGIALEDMRKVFAYEKGGNAELNHGTLRDSFKRNHKQALKIVKCGTVDPTEGFEKFN